MAGHSSAAVVAHSSAAVVAHSSAAAAAHSSAAAVGHSSAAVVVHSSDHDSSLPHAWAPGHYMLCFLVGMTSALLDADLCYA